MVQLTMIVLVSSILAVASAAPLQKRSTRTIADTTADWNDGLQLNTLVQNPGAGVTIKAGTVNNIDSAAQMRAVQSTSKSINMVPLATVKGGAGNSDIPLSDAARPAITPKGDTGSNVKTPVKSVDATPPAATGGDIGNSDEAPIVANSDETTTQGTIDAQTQAAQDTPNLATANAPRAAIGASAGPVSAKGFALQNGKDAQALNAKFATLSTSSACTVGESACVGTGFAQCVDGKFAITQCAGGIICAALPLVNSSGTSITCTTAADRDARIAATGA